MSNIPTVDAVHDEKIETAPEGIHPTGNNGINIERKFNDANSEEFTSRVMIIKKKVKRKDDGLLEIVCGWIVDHQIGLSINLLALLFLTHACFPRVRTHTRQFFVLSYYNPDTGKYSLGLNDAWMVSYWVVIFTGLRAAVMDYILMPLAKKGGVKTERDQTRFSEQAWLLVYCSVFWTLGMYILVNSDYWLNLKNLWTNFPDRESAGLLKWYILVQYAFWVQQIMVLHIEKRRKDHWQMFAHHIVTTLLIFSSYSYHQTRVSNLILCIMDVVDLFFPAAKCLKYLGYTTICNIMFGLFMVTWVAARHVIYMIIVYSVYAHSDTVSPPGCYRGKMGSITGPFPPPDKFGHLLEPFTDPEGLICWTGKVKWGFLIALLFLQFLTLVWFSMIVKVALKVLQGGQADDTRSDDEDEDETNKGEKLETIEHLDRLGELQPFEEEIGVESLNLKGRRSRASQNRYRKSVSNASGVSIADRKQLLGRIGCDKEIKD